MKIGDSSRVDQCLIIGDIFFCWVWIQQAKDYYITWEHISFAFSITLAAPRFRSNSKVGNSSVVPIFITSPHVSTIPDSIINTFIMSKSVHPRLPRPAMPMTADAGGLEVSKTRWYCCGWPGAKKCFECPLERVVAMVAIVDPHQHHRLSSLHHRRDKLGIVGARIVRAEKEGGQYSRLMNRGGNQQGWHCIYLCNELKTASVIKPAAGSSSRARFPRSLHSPAIQNSLVFTD